MHNKKLFLAAAAACLTTSFAAAQDECATAAAVGTGMTAFDTTTGTPSAEAWTCAGGSHTGGDLWYTYTAAANFGVTVSLCGSTYDTALSIYDGACGSLNLIQCNDDSCGLQSEISFVPVAGTTYTFRVGGFNASQGMGTMDVSELLTPPNDECAGAVALGEGTTAFDTTGATTSMPAWPCGGASAGGDIWYSYTAVDSVELSVTTCGSSYDTTLEIFDGDCMTLTSLACNDDACGLQSGVTITPTAGTTYLFRVGGFGGGTGAGQINIVEPLAGADECMDAIAVSEGTSATYSSSAATTSSTWPCALGGSDIWFSYTPTFSGDTTFSTCAANTNYDTAIELFEGDCASLTSIACNDDDFGCSFSIRRSTVSHCVTAGETYYVRVGGFNGATGNSQLQINNAAADACATTLFASNNGGAVGGMVYFDGTFTQDCPVASIAVNSSIGAGTPITVDVYTNPAGYFGNQSNPAGWTLLGSASGVAGASDTPSVLTPTAPFSFPAGTTGIAIHATDFNHSYTNGNGTNQSAASGDGVISLSLGSGSNSPFATPTFNPRVWNGWICRSAGLGSDYCPASLNSTGQASSLVVTGSACVSLDGITLTASNLPLNTFGFFICGQNTDMVPAGQGTICIGSPIGRGVGGAIYNSGSTGVISASSNLMLPQPTGAQQVLVGETWNFQCVHRDSAGGMATSNTSNAVSIPFI